MQKYTGWTYNIYHLSLYINTASLHTCWILLQPIKQNPDRKCLWTLNNKHTFLPHRFANKKHPLETYWNTFTLQTLNQWIEKYIFLKFLMDPDVLEKTWGLLKKFTYLPEGAVCRFAMKHGRIFGVESFKRINKKFKKWEFQSFTPKKLNPWMRLLDWLLSTYPLVN